MGFFDMFSSPAQPPVMDAGFVINQSAKQNQNAANNSAFLSNINQKTPYGSLTYNLLDGVIDYNGNWIPRFEAETKFSPEQQKLYDKQVDVTQKGYNLASDYMDRVGASTATPFSMNGAPAAPTTPTYSGPQYNDARRQDVYNAILDRNQSSLDRDRASMESRLANQGISLGTDAWKASYDDYNRGVNDFRLGADIQSGQEARADYAAALQGANQQFNADAARFGMGTDARKNWVTEQQMLRMQPIQEVAALMGTGGGQQYPSFVPTNNYQVQAPDVGGIYGMQAQQQQANYQAQQRAQSAGLGGLMGLLGTVGGAALMGPAGGFLGGSMFGGGVGAINHVGRSVSYP